MSASACSEAAARHVVDPLTHSPTHTHTHVAVDTGSTRQDPHHSDASRTAVQSGSLPKPRPNVELVSLSVHWPNFCDVLLNNVPLLIVWLMIAFCPSSWMHTRSSEEEGGRAWAGAGSVRKASIRWLDWPTRTLSHSLPPSVCSLSSSHLFSLSLSFVLSLSLSLFLSFLSPSLVSLFSRSGRAAT